MVGSQWLEVRKMKVKLKDKELSIRNIPQRMDQDNRLSGKTARTLLIPRAY